MTEVNNGARQHTETAFRGRLLVTLQDGGSYTWRWALPTPREDDSGGLLELQGTLPPDFSGKGVVAPLSAAVDAARALVRNHLTKHVPTLLTLATMDAAEAAETAKEA